MDERIDLSMSDPDLVPLLIQVYFLDSCGVIVIYLLERKIVSCYL